MEFLGVIHGVQRVRYFTEPYQKSGNFHEVKMENVIFSGAYTWKITKLPLKWVKIWYVREWRAFYFDYQSISRDNPFLLFLTLTFLKVKTGNQVLAMSIPFMGLILKQIQILKWWKVVQVHSRSFEVEQNFESKNLRNCRKKLRWRHDDRKPSESYSVASI